MMLSRVWCGRRTLFLLQDVRYLDCVGFHTSYADPHDEPDEEDEWDNI
jgi:hypothetical protein